MSELLDELVELRAFREEAADRRPPWRPVRYRSRRRVYLRRRLGLLIGLGLLAAVAVIAVAPARHADFAAPDRAALAGLGVRERIVTIASSQVGYHTDPTRSYCNKFSAAWGVGGTGCPAGERSEEWCADFAAWAWRHAGVDFGYGYGTDEINAGAASFYRWAVAAGRWHPASPGFRAAPGDVAVYGLDLSGTPTAAHVAVVTADPRGQDGPDVINGDGDRTGFSVVEYGSNELQADTGGGALLAGYASPY